MFGILNINGIALDKQKLEEYIEKFASDNSVIKNSDIQTYPINDMLKNFEFITRVYNLLNEHVKLKINIHPAGEWLLDNYYIIEENVKSVQKELSLNKYKNLVGISNGIYNGYARIYVLAYEILAFTENNVDNYNLNYILQAYQKKKSLSMEEIWNINIFLKIGLIENIARICEKIYSSQIQKYRAENIYERLVENKNKNELICSQNNKIQTAKIGYGELKYPFIEYLSYKLKKAGRKARNFFDVLEEQVNRSGTTISEVIKKEHYDIALKKLSMANSITTLKRLARMNFLEIFEDVNGVEEILKKDPAGIYEKMDFETKEYYRNVISEISKKTKISELYIAQKALELSQKGNNPKNSHIGYYLISDGKNNLYKIIGYKNNEINKSLKAKIYVYGISAVSLIITLAIMKNYYKVDLFIAIILSIFLFIPVSEIVVQCTQYILGKIVKPKILPKMDYSEGIPEEEATFVVVPTIIDSEKKVEEIIHKLEVYYLANRSDNLYFALLGDCTTTKNEVEEIDAKLIEKGKELVDKLNEKYNKKIFYFLYRKRKWNEKENAYLGWERKRGLLTQFNEYLLKNKKADFIINTIEEEKIPEIKNIITLDADTDLSLESAQKLIGTMGHILNKPEVKNGAVVKGHALIQPKVGINIEASRKSLFTQIFAGSGGTDLYTNAISDVYQDNFDEGIFTGKGIYNLKVFSEVLENQIPENTVLSHDLLEGSYLRCGLATDIMLMDGYPYKYNSFISRLHRWIRGDWQITGWLLNNIKDKNGKLHKNPLNFLSKFKILDNLRRSLLEISCVISLLLAIVIKLKFNVRICAPVIVVLIAILIPMILELINKIVFKKEGQETSKSFTPKISGIKGIITRAYLTFSFFPNKAYISLNAIIKTIYRKHFSKMHMLEWTTSEEAERFSKVSLGSYYTNMWVNILFAIISFILAYTSKTTLELWSIYSAGIIWAISPWFAYEVSKEIKNNAQIEKLNKDEKEYIQNIARETWQYFKDSLTEENNYLPPDNYQIGRKEKFVNRTSSTNIGLAMLAVISSYDLKYETKEYTINLLEKMLNTINSLQKWNGHLYNWYNIQTLQPLIPRYVSTVDSGNFVGYLYVVKQFLINLEAEEKYKNKINIMINIIDETIERTNFAVLYDYKVGLFSIGFNIEENKLTNSYYDLLASEARQASLVAISKGDVPVKHWRNLSRTLTNLNKHKGLISWSGTAFEYLMPTINIHQYEGSLLDESCKFMIMCQMIYSKNVGIPWGISESAFNVKDLHANYQYKAFGIPWLGLKRGLEDEAVVASYGSVLAINYKPKETIKNLKLMEEYGVRGKYGLYEAVDFTRNRMQKGKISEPVKTFMAHHQSLILLSINNLINNNIFQQRFYDNPEIEAIDILLQERMPEDMIITKEKKVKPVKVKYKDYESYNEEIITNIETIDEYNVISNENYSIITNQKGEGYSKYKNIIINRYKQTADEAQGMFFYLKNISDNRIWMANYASFLDKPDKYNTVFSPDSTKIVRQDGDIEITANTTVDVEEPIEIRNLKIKNIGNREQILEVTGSFEPIISTQIQDISHPVFNDLFLRNEFENENIIIERRQRDKNAEKIFLATTLFTENETIGDIEYELDKEKFFGRGNIQLPEMIKNSKPFSKTVGLITEPIIALKRTLKVMPGEEVDLNLIIAVSDTKEKAQKYVNEYKNQAKIKKNFQLEKLKSMEEIRYLGIKGTDTRDYKKLMSLLIVQNELKKNYIKNNNTYSQSDLWKFGISGDLPIVLVKIKDLNDSFVLEEVLKAYEYLRIKNIEFELVILNNEEYSYNSEVQDEIENIILNSPYGYMKNQKAGIFRINSNEISEEDLHLLEFRANVVLDSHLGSLENQLKDLEDEYKKLLKNIPEEKPEKIVLENETIRENKLDQIDNLENLKYYNEYGAFTKDGKEYVLKVNKENNLPTTWSHIIANEKFGTVVTEGLGGYTWNKNSRLNRITAWNNNPSQDIPSEIIYLKDTQTGKYWSLGARPCPDNNEYYIKYGFGYAEYEHFSLGIEQKLTVFVPNKESVKINVLNIKNTLPETKKLKLIYYIKPVLGEDELKSNGYINVEKDGNIIFLKNLYAEEFKSEIAFIGVSEKIKSFTGNKKSFIGSGNIANPEAINKIELDKESGLGSNSCAAIELEIELKAYEEKELTILLGEEENKINIKDIVYKYTNINNCKTELQNVKNKWNNILGKIQVETPMESINILLNGWALYQSLACRLYARTGYYQSGGAFGFRDQLQDTLCFKNIKPEIIKNQIIKHAAHQFIEGDVEHWWHDETERGIRTKFSDDLLWLAYMCTEYIGITGDTEILDIEVPYLQGELLDENTSERYDKYEKTEDKESIYNHCIKAIDRSLNFGENGLPKIGSGDWNDGFSEVGPKGKGESVWLGFFLYLILNRFAKILDLKEDKEKAEEYRKQAETLKRNLNKNAWDGRWYKRAFMDDGNVLGSIENEECRIDNIAQAWSVISEAGDNDKKYISMESLENHLIDKENSIIKLLDPPFDKSKLEPGYIKAYMPGVRENGGQYTHRSNMDNNSRGNVRLWR